MPRFLLYTIFSLSAIFVHAEGAQRLCYSPVSRSIQTGIFNDGVALANTPRNLRHELALRASMLIYQLGDLDSATTGDEFLAKFESFQRQVPRGYTYEYYFSNRASGLKYMILAPNTPTDPWLFAFAGTQSMLDWLSDLNLGRQQFAQVGGQLVNFTNCEYDNGNGKSLGSRTWIVTGHSLGGGLAETFAYNAQLRRLQMGLSPAPIELVTFNAFGAQDLVANSTAEAQPIVNTLLTANYFVTGDVVSRIGTHLGSTFELKMPNASIFQAANRHIVETVWNAAMKDGVPRFDLAIAATPPGSGMLTTLKNHASAFSFLVEGNVEELTHRLRSMNAMEDALNTIINRRSGGTYDRDAVSYMAGIALVFLKSEQERASTAMRDQLKKRLENFLNRTTIALGKR